MAKKIIYYGSKNHKKKAVISSGIGQNGNVYDSKNKKINIYSTDISLNGEFGKPLNSGATGFSQKGANNKSEIFLKSMKNDYSSKKSMEKDFDRLNSGVDMAWTIEVNNRL